MKTKTLDRSIYRPAYRPALVRELVRASEVRELVPVLLRPVATRHILEVHNAGRALEFYNAAVLGGLVCRIEAGRVRRFRLEIVATRRQWWNLKRSVRGVRRGRGFGGAELSACYLRLVRDDDELPELNLMPDASYSVNVFRLHVGTKIVEDACRELAAQGIEPGDIPTIKRCCERIGCALYVVGSACAAVEVAQ